MAGINSMAFEQDGVLQIVKELLAIARVAMPDAVYESDPRVHRALQLISAVSASATSHAQWDITAGLDAFLASDFAPKSRIDAVVLILRDWLTGHGYIEPPPVDEDRH